MHQVPVWVKFNSKITVKEKYEEADMHLWEMHS